MNLEIGARVGRLVVLGKAKTRGGKHSYLPCKCDCGKEWEPRRDSIVSGRIVSCGCYRDEMTAKRMTTHGQSPRKGRSGAYGTYCDMIQRCTNPKHCAFKHYGERGIKICDRWLDSFENFYEDMGERPARKTLDRIENDKGYCKENCKWSTHKEQMRNTRGNHFVYLFGERTLVADVAAKLGIPEHRVYSRVSQFGVSHQEATDYYANKTPRGDVKFVYIDGEAMSCAEAEKRLGVYQGAITCRIRRNRETRQQAVDHFRQRKGF